MEDRYNLIISSVQNMYTILNNQFIDEPFTPELSWRISLKARQELDRILTLINPGLVASINPTVENYEIIIIPKFDNASALWISTHEPRLYLFFRQAGWL